MPSTSPAQHKLMNAVAHNAKFAKKAGIPQKVGKEYAAADAARGIFGHKRASTTVMGKGKK